MSKPQNANSKKRDANDVLREDGVDELRRQFDVNRTVVPFKAAPNNHGDAQARSRAPGGREHAEANDADANRPGGRNTGAPPEPPHYGVRGPVRADKLADFFAHMPSSHFIFIPARDLWPAKSVDARIPPIATGEVDDTGRPKRIKASSWIREEPSCRADDLGARPSRVDRGCARY